MPDLTIVVMQQCKSIDGPLAVEVESNSTPGQTYTIWNLFSERHYPECDCPAYKFGERTVQFGARVYPPECKHILAAQKEACGWHQQWSNEGQTSEQREGMICPRCGSQTMWVRVGV